MRKINLTEPTGQAWKKWRTKCDAATRKCIDRVRRGQKITVSNLYQKQKSYFRDSGGPFLGKCAYCETKITSNQHGDIDHYRPKKNPLNLDWSPARIRKNGRLVSHPGYYWLAYAWRNLLLSCVLCNQVGPLKKYGKSNRFPVDGKRASAPGGERYEKPLLLNPCIDDPADHLTIDGTGVLVGLTERGKATIALLGLNDRDLPKERSRKYQDIETKYYAMLMRQRDMGHAWANNQLLELQSDAQDFTLAAKTAVSKARDSLVI